MRRQTRLGNRLSNLALGPCLTIVAPLAKVAVDDPPSRRGGVAEWLKAHAWKVCIGETLSRVRIPLPPPAVRKWALRLRLLPPVYVKPFVKRQKNDAADAEAIVEAAIRPSMRFVAPKT